VRSLAEIIPLRTPDCREAADAVPQIAAGEDGVEPRAAAHVRTCLRCQAELAAYRRILRIMRSMRHEIVPTSGQNLADLLRALHDAELADGQTTSWAVRAAYVGGITAAGAAGMLVWLTLRRPGLPDAG
jgi:hypothetical protein